MTQCRATSKRSGKPCQRSAMTNGLCYNHGGKSKQGLALPQTKHGRYSKDLPTRLLATYEASISDPELLNLSSEIALTESRMQDLIKRVDKGESDRIWRDIRATYKDMQAAQRAKDGAEVARLLGDMGTLISQGYADTVAWSEVMALIETRRKLVESEQKRRVAMQDMITSEKAMLLVTALVDAVQRHVSDRNTLATITAEFARITGVAHGDASKSGT